MKTVLLKKKIRELHLAHFSVKEFLLPKDYFWAHSFGGLEFFVCTVLFGISKSVNQSTEPYSSARFPCGSIRGSKLDFLCAILAL